MLAIPSSTMAPSSDISRPGTLNSVSVVISRMKRLRRGFSLLEVMIVVVIIGIL
ncbi:MAG: prepilin-type N-terminal cleavage/methylation domain-containing protein, partial [Erythrobacter sp.]|nr:prepilin-type N-terminal cleavage/methylation domain-containing protein [Erythrobacter sp.]